MSLQPEFLREFLELAGEGQRAQLYSEHASLCPERELNFFRQVFLRCVGVELCYNSLELFPVAAVPVQAAQSTGNTKPQHPAPAAA